MALAVAYKFNNYLIKSRTHKGMKNSTWNQFAKHKNWKFTLKGQMQKNFFKQSCQKTLSICNFIYL